MHAAERRGQLAGQFIEGAGGRSCPGYEHIVEAGQRRLDGQRPERRLQSAPNSVPYHGATDLLRHGEPEPRSYRGSRRAAVIVRSRLRLQDECARCTPRTATDPKKLGSSLERDDVHIPEACSGAHRPARRLGWPLGLRRQALAPFRPPARDDSRATRCRHAFTETMPPFAHESAGLVRSFHDLGSNCRRASGHSRPANISSVAARAVQTAHPRSRCPSQDDGLIGVVTVQVNRGPGARFAAPGTGYLTSGCTGGLAPRTGSTGGWGKNRS